MIPAKLGASGWQSEKARQMTDESIDELIDQALSNKPEQSDGLSNKAKSGMETDKVLGSSFSVTETLRTIANDALATGAARVSAARALDAIEMRDGGVTGAPSTLSQSDLDAEIARCRALLRA